MPAPAFEIDRALAGENGLLKGGRDRARRDGLLGRQIGSSDQQPDLGALLDEWPHDRIGHGGGETVVNATGDEHMKLAVPAGRWLRQQLPDDALPQGKRMQRSDVTAVAAMGVIAETMVALMLTEAMLEKFGGDSLSEMKRNFDGYQAHLRTRAPKGAAS